VKTSFDANNPTLKSWVAVPEGSDFPINELKETLSKIKRVAISVKKARGKEIYDEYIIEYVVTGVIKDVEWLKNTFCVFELMLDEFLKNNIAKSEKPHVELFKE